MERKAIYIGTSGWSYPGWIGIFYPEKIKPEQVLPCYTQTFGSVELNNSFYQVPKEKNVRKWVAMTPPDFVFSCKANRYITHIKRLRDITDSTIHLLQAFSHFEEKLGAILFQFPPYWPLNIPVLKAFVETLPRHYLYTFEFRHQSWFCDALYELLHQHDMSLCFYDFKTYQTPEVVTGSFIYIRMHGPNPEAYQGSYGDETLKRCASRISAWHNEGKPVFCYFDNDEKCCAPHDALRLQTLLKPAFHP